MKGLIISAILVLILIVAACTTSRRLAKKNYIINDIPIQIKLDTVKGFDALMISQSGYGSKYQKLIDSLSLNSTDTVGFFIRPCFTHRGVFFKKGRLNYQEYYFNFSGSQRQVIAKNNSNRIGSDFFSFMCDSLLRKKEFSYDSVVLIPDCPVILFIKLNAAFYYRKISGLELKYFSDNSIVFDRLIKETIQ